MVAALLAPACGPGPEFRDVVIDHSDRPLGEILAGVAVEQSFVPNHDHLSGVALMLATYGGRARGCRVVLRLRAFGSENDIASQTNGCSEIPDNGWMRFDFPPLPGTRGQMMVLRIESPNGRPGDALTAWISSVAHVYPDGALTVDGVPIDGALRFVTFHR